MAHTFTCLYYHVVFATRFRHPLIAPEVRPRLWAYMGGIARENRFPALTIGGMSDHAHVLISLNPSRIDVDHAVAASVPSAVADGCRTLSLTTCT